VEFGDRRLLLLFTWAQGVLLTVGGNCSIDSARAHLNQHRHTPRGCRQGYPTLVHPQVPRLASSARPSRSSRLGNRRKWEADLDFQANGLFKTMLMVVVLAFRLCFRSRMTLMGGLAIPIGDPEQVVAGSRKDEVHELLAWLRKPLQARRSPSTWDPASERLNWSSTCFDVTCSKVPLVLCSFASSIPLFYLMFLKFLSSKLYLTFSQYITCHKFFYHPPGYDMARVALIASVP
jgi:hypothetical protein